LGGLITTWPEIVTPCDIFWSSEASRFVVGLYVDVSEGSDRKFFSKR
jgi:hypothetical protein